MVSLGVKLAKKNKNICSLTDKIHIPVELHSAVDLSGVVSKLAGQTHNELQEHIRTGD